MKSALPLNRTSGKSMPLFLFLFLALLSACGTSKKFKATDQADKPLFDAINELNKRPGSEKAQGDLRMLYKRSQERHEAAIEAYKLSADENRWDRILNEYGALEHIYNSMQAVPGTFSLVKPRSYLRESELTRNDAAEDFYQRAAALLANATDRNGFLQANSYFRRSGQYIPGYKDIDQRIRESYEKSIVNVVVNPIEDNTLFFLGNNWGMPDFRYRPQEFQDMLIRDLGGRSASRMPARFYSDRDIRRERIMPDWEINMRWRNINPVVTSPRQSNRQLSKNVQVGRDTSGKPVYQTVYATLYINETQYSIRGDVEYQISDLVNKTVLDNGIASDELTWFDRSATYTGDSRALGPDDWNLVNNRNNNELMNNSRGQVLTDLLRRIYPDLRRRIEQRMN